MSDSSPENFMEQALALITQLKQALTESFSKQNERIDESFVAQDKRINAIATDYAFLKTDFEQHKNNHVSKSDITTAITTHAQLHNQELQNAGFISIAIYTAQINKFEAEIAALRKQIKNIPQSITLAEEGTDKSDGTADTADGAQNNQHTPTTSTTPSTNHGVNDPDVSTLETAILQAIRSSSEFSNIVNNKRDKILEKADELKRKDPSINDNILSMQVILALYYLINLRPQTLAFYKKCYQKDSKAFNQLQSIIKLFIVSNTPTVTHNTFQKAINDDNFKTIITPEVVLPGNYDTNFINKINPKNSGARK